MLHQAFIGVDEAGTEAAAATAVVVGVTSAPIGEVPRVTADRAFLFVLGLHVELFTGRVSDPTAG